jgi:flavin-dependent dehydrogenase
VNVGVGGWKGAVGTELRPQLDGLCRSYGIDPAKLVNLRGHHLPMQRIGTTIASNGSALIGDAAGLVDPLSGEGIYAAISSGIAVAPAVEDYLAGRADSLASYQEALSRELIPELATSGALMEIFHASPAPFTRVLQRSNRVWTRCARLVRGEITHGDVVRTAGPLMATLGPLAAAARWRTRRRHGRS